MSAALGDALETRRLVVFVGEGGVGKTSCAAATGLAAAARGKHVAVLTIDPAPRLGDALGLDRIDARPQVVESTDAARAGGRLVAFRLDTERTFDRVVERLAPSEEAAAAILANPLYRAIAGSLGGSDAYMALQRLYELEEEGAYDLIVVDTPPAVHAHELLSAPSRLAALVETGASKILINPALIIARAGSTVARTTAAVLLPVLERVSGLALRSQIAEFIVEFEHVLQALVERAKAVETVLADEGTAFVIVARPVDEGVGAALALEVSLAERGIGVEAIVANRLTPPSGRDRLVGREARLAQAPAGTAEAVARMERDMDARRAAEAKAVARLRNDRTQRSAGTRPVIAVFALDHDLAQPSDLAQLARALWEGEPADRRPAE